MVWRVERNYPRGKRRGGRRAAVRMYRPRGGKFHGKFHRVLRGTAPSVYAAKSELSSKANESFLHTPKSRREGPAFISTEIQAIIAPFSQGKCSERRYHVDHTRCSLFVCLPSPTVCISRCMFLLKTWTCTTYYMDTCQVSETCHIQRRDHFINERRHLRLVT